MSERTDGSREVHAPPPVNRICPKCGSSNTDCPRTYDMRQFSPRFVGCRPECLDCGHLGQMFNNIPDAFRAWEKSA